MNLITPLTLTLLSSSLWVLPTSAANQKEAQISTTSESQSKSSSLKKPNIIFILADDLGNGDLAYNGCKDIHTPNIDKLAASGIIFTNHHTTASVCAPSRAGIFSGIYQQKFGFECNSPHGKNGMPSSITTYAEAMKMAGYETMALGKWHLGSIPEMHPNQQGFDHFSGFIGGGRSYFPIVNKKPGLQNLMQRNGKPVPEKEITYVTDWLTDEAIRLIEHRDTSKPFFMYLGYNAPHAPMQAKKSDLEKYNNISNKGRRTYAAMVDSLDQGVGKIRAYLDQKKLTDNTIILFSSDNGGATCNSSDNGIYRGMKGSEWDGGHRVPCIVSWPKGGFTGGKTTHSLTSTLDFMATSVDAAGKKELISKLKLDGLSLLPIAKDLTAKIHTRLFSRRAAPGSTREKQWKLIRVQEEDKSYRYLLFDLSKDVGETNDLAAQNPERVAELAKTMKAWESPLMQPLWREGDIWENYQRLKHNVNVIGRAAERKLP